MISWLVATPTILYEIIGLVLTLIASASAFRGTNYQIRALAGMERALIGGTLSEQRSTAVGWIRQKAQIILDLVPVPLSWPVQLWFAIQAFRREEWHTTTRTKLLPYYTMVSLWLTLISGVVALEVATVGHAWYLIVGCWGLIIANLARQLSSFVAGGLRAQLRQSVVNPFLQLGMIAVADFVTLVVAAVVLRRWAPDMPFEWTWLRDEAGRLLELRHLREALLLRQVGPADLIIGIAGLGVYFFLLSQLKQPAQFKRTANDRLQIAVTYLLADDNKSAKKWLRPLLEARNKDDWTLSAQGVMALSEGQWHRAMEFARVAALIRWSHSSQPEERDDALAVLAGWAAPFAGKVGMNCLIPFAVQEGISDAALVCLLPRPSLALPEAAEFVELTRPYLAESAYPLSLATLDIIVGDLEAARRRLRERKNGQAVEKIVGEMLSREPALTSDAHAGIAWVIEESENWPIGELPEWSRLWLSVELFILREIASVMGQQTYEAQLNLVRCRLLGPTIAARQEGALATVEGLANLRQRFQSTGR